MAIGVRYISLFHHIFMLSVEMHGYRLSSRLESSFKVCTSVAPGKKGEAKAATHTDPCKQGATLGIGLYSRFQRARLLNKVDAVLKFPYIERPR